MASPQNAIIIDDDDHFDKTRNILSTRRARSVSVISSASGHTLRAETPEHVSMPGVERLSVQPLEESQPYRTGNSHTKNNNERKRISNEPDRLDGQGSLRQRRRMASNSRSRQQVIDFDEDGLEIHSYNPAVHEFIDLDDVDVEAKLEEEIARERSLPRNLQSRQTRTSQHSRNSPITLPSIELGRYKWNAHFLKAYKTVELMDGTFLKIKNVIQDLATDKVMVRGWQLRRSRELGGILPLKVNEVCFVFETDLDDPRPCLEQSVVEVELNELKQIRKLVCTNKSFPECRFDNSQIPFFEDSKEAREYVEKREVLVARWKLTTRFDSAQARLQHGRNPNNFRRRQLESLSDNECSLEQSVQASIRRYTWREHETMFGGSVTATEMGNVNTGQMYTYGDGYSGAGGTMRGALMGGLKPIWGLDFNSDACATLRANFRDIQVFDKWVHEFVALPDPAKKLVVDILHLSPPCQFFSPIHVHAGKDDEMNFASLFGVQELIKKSRPRIVTLEQTFGIMHLKKFRTAFNQLIRMFSDNGFSTCWQVVELQRFGLPARRKRLIIVAAGPGETLPEFPRYTHSEYGSNSLQPYTSVGKVLRSIPRNATQNAPTTASRSMKYAPWDDSTILNCITTNGGDKGHPNGMRGFTYRELAALQGFPHTHFFTGNTATVIKKQIGNAVPPLFADILFRSIVKHLKKIDTADKRRGANH